MKAGFELFLLRLNKKDLQILPQGYQEMFDAWYAIEGSVEYKSKNNDIYHYCLFCNPQIVINNKMLKWDHFIRSGITNIKDITYEVIPGFLPVSCIVEMIQEDNSDIDIKVIKENYNSLKSIIPIEWQKYVCENEYIKHEFVPNFHFLDKF